MKILLKILLLPIKLVALVLAVILKFVAWLALMAANLFPMHRPHCRVCAGLPDLQRHSGKLAECRAAHCHRGIDLCGAVWGRIFIGAVQLMADGLKAFVFS